MALAPLYAITGHPLLSADTATLSADELAAQTVISEEILGLDGTSYEDDDADKAKLANVLQVNYQVALPPEEWLVLRDKRGQREKEYRDGVDPSINPAAKAIADSLAEDASGSDTEGWAVMGPRR